MVPERRLPCICFGCDGGCEGVCVCPHAVTALKSRVPIRLKPNRRCHQLCMSVFLLMVESPLIARPARGKFRTPADQRTAAATAEVQETPCSRFIIFTMRG